MHDARRLADQHHECVQPERGGPPTDGGQLGVEQGRREQHVERHQKDPEQARSSVLARCEEAAVAAERVHLGRGDPPDEQHEPQGPTHRRHHDVVVVERRLEGGAQPVAPDHRLGDVSGERVPDDR